MAKRNTTTKTRGSVALYGVRETGAGWIAVNEGTREMFGDGEPSKDRSFTDALWLGLRAVRASGVTGEVEVTIDTNAGPRRAIVASGASPYFGDLKWEAGTVYVVAAEAIRSTK